MLKRMRQAVVEMQENRLLSIRERGVIVSCVEGRIWITRDRDPVDRLLAPGEAYEVVGARRVLIQALTAARVRLEARGSRAARLLLGGLAFASRTLR